ncbi:MAG: radical SAM family heme chaperone HemW [Thioalkalispiraceae bacterium]|jgi:oxygen-independent coproporphyrinogen-3 oxidase
MQQFSELPPLGLYIHFPWCVKKCPYCDFNSHTVKDELPEADYINRLLDDLDQELPGIWGRKIHSIFMGGGTPSLFSARAMDQLISGLRARLNLKPDLEITMEANPGTVEQAKFSEFYTSGINRLSIGVQSFNNSHLQTLGRIHDARQAIKAIEAAHQAGFERINIDLMYGLPGQTPGEAAGDIQMAVAMHPSHISYYQLTLEPNTYFHAHPPLLPDDERIADIEERSREQLALNNFDRYEISAYAKPGEACQHNLNYWQFGDYLGIGAGAHGKLTHVASQQIQRSWKVKNPRDYLAAAKPQERISGTQILDQATTAFEFFLNSMRLTEGFESALFQQRTGLPISHVEQQLQQAESRGLIEWGLKHIKPTQTGLQFLNNLTELFLPAESGSK